ncbi:MAG: PilN domain-containing protein [bacterium]
MIRINLLSDREAIRKESVRQQLSIYLLSLVLTAVVLGGIQFTLFQKKRGLEEDVARVDQELKELKLKVGEVEKYKEAKKELETKLAVIETLEKGKMLTATLLDGIAERIPDKMWLERLVLKGSQLSLQGYAIDNETIANFMKDLEKSQSFRNIELQLTEQKTVEGVGMKHFSLVTSMRPPAGADAPEAGTKVVQKKQ